VTGTLASAAARYRIAVGPIAGRKTMTLHSPGNLSGECAPAKTLTAAGDGFCLNASVVCEAHQRAKLERLCRYVSRGPIAVERLSIDGDGLVVHELKHRFRDGTTQVLFEPLDFAAPAHPCARGISASMHVVAEITEPALFARLLEHRDARADFRGKVPACGARAPPPVSLH